MRRWPSWRTCSAAARRAGRSQRSRALTLCLITDRARLLAAVNPGGEWQRVLFAQLEGAIAAGIDVIQVRERGLDDRVLAAVVGQCVRLTRGTSTRVLVNDRLDVALAAGAHGVHLREGSMGIDAARRLTPSADFLVGRSVHDEAGARAARGADYLMAGSVFATASKPGQPASLGLDGLKNLVKAAAPRDVWAIGGIGRDRIPAVAGSGVAGIAAIGAFIPQASTADIAGEVRKLVQELRFSFDSLAELS